MNLDFTRTGAGSVKIDRNGNVRYIVNPQNATIKLLPRPDSGTDTIRIRSNDDEWQVTAVVAEITNINGVPFVGTTADAMASLANTVFNEGVAS